MNNPSRTGTVTPAAHHYRQSNAASASFDSLAEKRSLALNSSVEDDLRSYDVYEAHNTNPMAAGVLGSHISPNPGGHSSFVDMHDVHYAGHPNGSMVPKSTPVSYIPQGALSGMNVNATVHNSGIDLSSYDNQAYRPDTRQSQNQDVWRRDSNDISGQGPPGYSSRPNLAAPAIPSHNRPDSVADMKRELREVLDKESPSTGTDPEEVNTTLSDTSSSVDQNQRPVGDEYQTMDRSLYEASTFRPAQVPVQIQPNNPNISSRPLPPINAGNDRIPSVPGYAKPYAHSAQRPFQPPPEPPKPLRTSLKDNEEGARSRKPLLETTLDNETRPSRSRSVGQLLETNLDDDGDGDDEREEETAEPNFSNGHSRSLGENRFPRMSLGPANSALLETDM